MDGGDFFDLLPDPIILLIFNQTRDIKSLTRCRAVSTRFNSLVPQTDSLCLLVDRVVSAGDSDSDDSFLSVFLRSVFKSLYELVSTKPLPDPTRSQNSPNRILRGFEQIRSLEIKLPPGDLRLEKGTTVRWCAEFGNTLRSCVILGFRPPVGDEVELDGGELKTRVIWTISALIAASARHYMVRDLVKEHKHLEKLVIRDREGEGTVVMERDGLREIRERIEEEAEDEEAWWHSSRRTTVPAVRMRMRHEPKVELRGGEEVFEGATLVVVRPAVGGGDDVDVAVAEEEESPSDRDLGPVFEAFEGAYGEVVGKLLESRSYLLEMNSF